MPARDPDPRSFLPLTPLAFQALLALVGAERHGYAIIQEIDAHTDGGLKLRTGTLYTVLQRLVDEGLIRESDERPDDDDRRRRYYALTDLGRAVVSVEARRLDGLVSVARHRRLLGPSSRG